MVVGTLRRPKKGTTFHVSLVDQYGESDSTPGFVEGPETPVAEIGEELPRPVAVDGRGGALPSEITKHDNEHQQIERVTPTAEWTEKPVLPSQKVDTLPLAIERGEATIVALSVGDGKDKCKDVAKDNSAATSLGSLPHCMQGSTCIEGDQEGYAGNKPCVSALSTCDILAPIPEADVAVDNGSNVEASNIVAKPKALPLKVSPAARKGLAKVVTSRTQPVRTQGLLGGYAVEANVKPANPSGLEATSIREVPSKIDVCPVQSRTAGRPCFGSQGESDEHRPGHKSLRRSKSAGQPPLTPGRRAGTTARLKASPAKEVIKYGGKARKEQVGTGETAKGGPSERKGKHGEPPLRRAGMDTTRKLGFSKNQQKYPVILIAPWWWRKGLKVMSS